MRVLSRSDQKKVVAVTLIQISMGALDLLGVVAIGLLGALSVTGLQSHAPGDRVGTALRLLHISNVSFQTQASVIGVSAIFLLVGRTILSIFFSLFALNLSPLSLLASSSSLASAFLLLRSSIKPILVLNSAFS